MRTRGPHSLIAAATVAAIAIAGAGCTTVGPSFTSPAEPAAPASWADRHAGSPLLAAPAASASPLPADRWQAFADPTLLALQAKAREGNADLASAALRLAESRAERSTVAAQRGVQANAKGSIARQRQSEFGSATRFVGALPGASREQLLSLISEPYTLYQAGFDASWELDLWGRVARSIEAADAQSDAAQATLADVRATITAEVARGYLELRATQRQIAIAQRQRAVADDALDLTRARVRGGLVDDTAALRQQTVVADLDARLPPLLDREGDAMRRIERLCGELPGALGGLLARRETGRPLGPRETASSPAAGKTESSLGSRETAAPLGLRRTPSSPASRDASGDLAATAAEQPWPDLALGVPSELIARRPDIAAAAARLHAATAQIGVATADLYPRITIGASFGSEATSAGRFGDWGSRQWQVGPSLTVPIFDAGRRRSTVLLREIGQQQAAVAYQQAVLAAWHEVDAAIASYQAERQREQRLAEKARASDDAFTVSRARFERGLTDALPLLDAERTRLDAERELAESQGRVGTALVAVFKALGESGREP